MTPPVRTIAQLLADQAHQRGNAPFLWFAETGEEVSYITQAMRAARVAHYLRSLGLQPGDRVGMWLPNIPRFVDWFWGAMVAGCVAVPLNTGLKAEEAAFILDNAEVSALVSTPAFFDDIGDIKGFYPCASLKHGVWVHDRDDGIPLTQPAGIPWAVAADVLAEQPETLTPFLEANSDPRQLPALIIYTSGTTGKPKGVVLSHHNLQIDAHYICDWFGFNESTRLMNILPLFHVNGEIVTLMTPWVAGGAVVLNRKFSASIFWSTIAQYKVNAFSTVPTILSMLIAQGTDVLSGFDISTLNFGICGAAPLPVEVHKQFEATFNVPIFEGYGLSETTCYSSFNPPDVAKRKIGSIGVAVGNQMAIWQQDKDEPVPQGDEGEVVASGENVMLEYFKRPDANEACLRTGPDGATWFRTGDWGKVDADGFYYLLDRVKDIIIRGGENIMPREIDEVLYRHPAVAHAATIGVPHPTYGESVVSAVVLEPNAPTTTADELIAFCHEHLARFKCPERIAFVDDIPKGPTGKLLRRALRDQLTPSSA